MNNVLVVKKFANRIEKIPAHPHPVSVIAWTVETEEAPKYLLNSDGKLEKLPPYASSQNKIPISDKTGFPVKQNNAAKIPNEQMKW